jgi:hypothetical protein
MHQALMLMQLLLLDLRWWRLLQGAQLMQAMKHWRHMLPGGRGQLQNIAGLVLLVVLSQLNAIHLQMKAAQA